MLSVEKTTYEELKRQRELLKQSANNELALTAA